MEILTLNGGPGDGAAFARAELAVRSGGTVIFPTDTFYALGADPRDPAAVERLYRLKGRPGDKPVLLLIGEASWAEELWGGVDPQARELMERWWPGPLTIIAPPGPGAPRLPGRGGLALRQPGNDLTLSLLRHLGRPLTGTSANPSGMPPPRSARQAAEYFPAGIDLALDGGTFSGKSASTIVEITPGGVKVLRMGAIYP